MLEIIKVLIPGIVAFAFGIAVTPMVLLWLYKLKVWRKNGDYKEVRLLDELGTVSEVINKTDKDLQTPRMGGIVIVISVFFTVFLFWFVSFSFFGHTSGKIDFLSRAQTWLPLTAFGAGMIMGFLDDYFTIRHIGKFKNGLPLLYRIVFVALFATLAGSWFVEKLGMESIFVPFYGELFLGIFFLPFFVLVFTAIFATSNIDGLDGLSGGVMAIIYAALGFIAFWQDKFDIATFCLVIVGATLSFLWFNVSPARFYMTEIGYNALSFTLVIIAFMTDTVLLFPIIALVLFINLWVTVIQVFSIRIFKKRVFKAAPLHHHLEISGWSESQIVVRYWIISAISAMIGIILAVVVI